jgi:hypothetical protein
LSAAIPLGVLKLNGAALKPRLTRGV